MIPDPNLPRLMARVGHGHPILSAVGAEEMSRLSWMKIFPIRLESLVESLTESRLWTEIEVGNSY